MNDHTADLAALIGSRICHDLISPIGAISNGIELMGLSGCAAGPELPLISESAENAGARIRFFRIAFGAAGEQVLGKIEVESVLRDYYSGSRISVDWTPETAAPRAQVRMVFLAILCMETALPHGGSIRVETDGATWEVAGLSPDIAADGPNWARLATGEGPEAPAPANVQFALLAHRAAEAGKVIRVQDRKDGLAVGF